MSFLASLTTTTAERLDYSVESHRNPPTKRRQYELEGGNVIGISFNCWMKERR